MSTHHVVPSVHLRTWPHVIGVAAAAGAATAVGAWALSLADAYPLATLADSRAVWGVVAWGVAVWLGPDLARGAAAGAVVMLVAVLGFTVLDPAHFLGSSGWPDAVVIGVLLGSAGAVSRRSEASEATLGLAAPIAVLAAALMTRLGDALLGHRLDQLAGVLVVGGVGAVAGAIVLSRSWPRPALVAPALALAVPLGLVCVVVSYGLPFLG